MDLFNIISGICSIVGLMLSIFVAGKVIKIANIINVNIGSTNDGSKRNIKIQDGIVSGDVIAGDKNHV